jgi:hypothetical protein
MSSSIYNSLFVDEEGLAPSSIESRFMRSVCVLSTSLRSLKFECCREVLRLRSWPLLRLIRLRLFRINGSKVALREVSPLVLTFIKCERLLSLKPAISSIVWLISLRLVCSDSLGLQLLDFAREALEGKSGNTLFTKDFWIIDSLSIWLKTAPRFDSKTYFRMDRSYRFYCEHEFLLPMSMDCSMREFIFYLSWLKLTLVISSIAYLDYLLILWYRTLLDGSSNVWWQLGQSTPWSLIFFVSYLRIFVALDA